MNEREKQERELWLSVFQDSFRMTGSVNGARIDAAEAVDGLREYFDQVPHPPVKV